MKSHWQPFLLLFLLPVLLPVSSSLLAAPLLSVQQTRQLNSLCSGTGALPASTLQTGVLAYDSVNARVSPLHDALPSAIRADSVAATGVVMCVQSGEVVLETCSINLFFTLPRVQQRYQLQLRSVRNAGQQPVGAMLAGSAPPACANPGPIAAGQTSLRGGLPPPDDVVKLLGELRLSTADDDADGYSNLAEWIRDSSATDASSPGPTALITANGSTALVVAEGEALTLQLSLQPAGKLGLPTDYFVWAEARGQLYAYLHGTGFRPANSKQLSVRATALALSNFPLVTLPGLGIGDYTLHFEARINDGSVLDSTASISVQPSQWNFVEVSKTAGLNHTHGFKQIADGIGRDRQLMAAGVAAGDFDNDGWIDLYITRGSIGANLLYRNLGNGSFVDVAANAGVAITGEENSGATFADYDGDGWLDLLVAGINASEQPRLFHNNKNSTFTDVTGSAGIPLISQTMGASFADYDKDGDLDFWITHWAADTQQKYLFRNNGNSSFTDISRSAGIADDLMNDFTANFADINNDSWPDLLVAADFKTSQVYLNQRNGNLLRTTNATVSDENGMGGAVGDYDNDGDLDWFVSSIYDTRPADLNLSPSLLGITWGQSGNRFYRNRGDGSFDDVTTLTGTRSGGWGWGSCFADFNNDGHLDLFHVNGYDSSTLGSTTPFPFRTDASRLFINDHNGSFSEQAVALGINDNQQGRGIVCFDYDRDGDMDLFVANNGQAPLLYENRGLKAHWLQVRVAGEANNSEAIGARVYVSANGLTQMRELSAGSNFMSQNPAIAYFGLGNAMQVESVRVVWPSGAERTVAGVAADQLLLLGK